MLKATNDPQLRAVYEARRAAIKWMLVSCFGYLGYLSLGGQAKRKVGKAFTSLTYKRRRLGELAGASKFNASSIAKGKTPRCERSRAHSLSAR